MVGAGLDITLVEESATEEGSVVMRGEGVATVPSAEEKGEAVAS